MLTIFTNPRPFQGPFDIIQRNAIKSWMLLEPRCQIILFEDEEKTTSKIAKEFGLSCIPDVACDEFGTPLLSDVFERVREIAEFEILAQVNTDIILMNNFIEAVRRTKKLMANHPFFMTGQRWNLDIKELIDFNENDWQLKLTNQINKEGKLHRFSGMDYWIFPFNFPINPPPFVVGRPGMDSWLIYKSRSLKIPVIDATPSMTIIHQNHNYPRKKSSFFNIEKKRNIELAGGLSKMGTLRDADLILTLNGFKKPEFPRIIFSKLSTFYPWRMLLAIKRRLRQFFYESPNNS